VLLMASICSALGDPLEDAGAAYGRKDYAIAVEIWRTLAEKGDPEAELQLGTMYEIGKGVPQSSELAASWFEKSARQGNASAQFLLATSYAKGRGVPVNLYTARQWYEKSADQNNSAAQTNLALFILSMSGSVRDPVLAFKWLDIAASNKSSTEYVRKWASSHRDDLAREMNAEQIAAARKLVAAWKSETPDRE
jgi:TPR repeat protein